MKKLTVGDFVCVQVEKNVKVFGTVIVLYEKHTVIKVHADTRDRAVSYRSGDRATFVKGMFPIRQCKEEHMHKAMALATLS